MVLYYCNDIFWIMHIRHVYIINAPSNLWLGTFYPLGSIVIIFFFKDRRHLVIIFAVWSFGPSWSFLCSSLLSVYAIKIIWWMMFILIHISNNRFIIPFLQKLTYDQQQLLSNPILIVISNYECWNSYNPIAYVALVLK